MISRLRYNSRQLVSPFLNRRAKSDPPLCKPALTVVLRCDWLTQRLTPHETERVLALIFHTCCHTPSIAFRHLPPNSARFSYASEEALIISAQLSSDAVSALQKVRTVEGRVGTDHHRTLTDFYDCRSNLAPKHARKHETHPPRVKNEFRLDSNDCGFI